MIASADDAPVQQILRNEHGAGSPARDVQPRIRKVEFRVGIHSSAEPVLLAHSLRVERGTHVVNYYDPSLMALNTWLCNEHDLVGGNESDLALRRWVCRIDESHCRCRGGSDAEAASAHDALVQKNRQGTHATYRVVCAQDYDALRCAVAEQLSPAGAECVRLPDERWHLAHVAEIAIDRTTYHMHGDSLMHVDRMEFPMGDPHCVCTLTHGGPSAERTTFPDDIYDALVPHMVAPVHDGICEYLSRYGHDVYYRLEHLQQLLFDSCWLDDQWAKVEDATRTDRHRFYDIQNRMERKRLDAESPPPYRGYVSGYDSGDDSDNWPQQEDDPETRECGRGE